MKTIATLNNGFRATFLARTHQPTHSQQLKQSLVPWKSVALAAMVIGVCGGEKGFAQIVTSSNYSATSFTAFSASATDLIENGSIYRLGSTISGPNAFNNTDAQTLMTDGTVQRFAAWYPSATDLNPTIVTFLFDLTQGANGYDITSLNSIAAYDSGGMYINQNFDVYVSYVSSPSTFHLLQSVFYSPLLSNLPGPGSSQVTLTDNSGPLATGVDAIQFQFKSNGANGQIIGEEDVFGAPTPVPEPSALALLGGGITALLALRKQSGQV